MAVEVGDRAPDLKVSEWVQGGPTNISEHRGRTVLLEVFQVNCPAAVLYGLSNAEKIYNSFPRDEVAVLGLATAFEDHALNNLENLRKLLYERKVVGETREELGKRGYLRGDVLDGKVSFPIARDRLSRPPKGSIYETIYGDKEVYPETFHEYGLMGTPSSVVIDANGVVAKRVFGTDNKLKSYVKKMVDDARRVQLK